MKKVIYVVGVFLCLCIFVEIIYSQPIARRFVKIPESSTDNVTLKVSVSVNGWEGDINVVEIPPKGWAIGRVIPEATIENGIISWKKTINRKGITRTFFYDLTIPTTDTSGKFQGKVNDQEIINVRVFDSSIINPGIQTPVQTDFKYDYLLYLPPTYDQQTQPWPLLLYLHGGGQRGSDLNLIKFDGPPKIVEDPSALTTIFGSSDFPFVLVSPQTPSGLVWENPPLLEILEDMLSNYNIDESKIYVTGFSMGGFGTWSFASEHADLTAAIVPIAGGRDLRVLFRNFASVGVDLREAIPENLVEVPVWAFHGDRDTVIPIQMDLDIVEPLQSLGGNIRFTVYPSVGHDSWTQTYNNPDVYQWLLSQQNKPVNTSVNNWEIY